MAHKALIGGTAYEISGGKTLIDGTAFSIKNGKTLIGGTAYEVGFGGFEIVIDLGAVTADRWHSGFDIYTSGDHPIIISPFPAGYDACTHIVIDGEMYEVTTTIDEGYSVSYRTVDATDLYDIILYTYDNPSSSVTARYRTEGTHTIQLGILS